MKKFLAIAAMSALIVTSAFSVDVAAMIQLDGDAMNLATSDDGATFKALKLKSYDPSGDVDYLWKLSVNGEKAGGEIWEWDLTSSAISNVKIWVAPTDWLKVTLGNVGGQSIAYPRFGWEAQTAQNYSYGYQAEVTFGNLYAKLALEPGSNNYWFDTSSSGYDMIGGFWAEAKYDLGNWGAVQAVAVKNGYIGAHGFSYWYTSPLAFGVAYANMDNQTYGYYADAYLSFKNGDDGLEFQGFDSQVGGQWISDFGLKIEETNVFQYRNAFKYGFEIKATYNFGAIVTPYVQIDGYDIMASTPATTFCIGMDAAIGGCAINSYLCVPVVFSDTYHFYFSVPVEFTLYL